MEKNFQTLGIDENASLEEIRARYRFLVKAYHPDRYSNADDKLRADEELKKINEAFTALEKKMQNTNNSTSSAASNDQQQARAEYSEYRSEPPFSSNRNNDGYKETGFGSKHLKNYCKGCGAYTYTFPATYRKNVGLFFLRRYKKVEGEFCSDCHEMLFWNAFLTNLFLGWWGVISSVINPFLIIMNIGNYIKSWKIRPHHTPTAKLIVDLKLLIPLLAILSWWFIMLIGLNDNDSYLSSTLSATITPQKTYVVSLEDLENSIKDSSSMQITYTTDFISNDHKWSMESIGDETITIKDGQLSIGTIKGSCGWSTLENTYEDAILEVDIANAKTKGENLAYVIQWRKDVIDGSYTMFISQDGSILIYKVVGEDDEYDLYLSNQPEINFDGVVTPIYISFSGSNFSIYTDDKVITTFNDYSHSSGNIALGLCTSSDESGKVFYDSVTISSYAEARKPTPTKYATIIYKTPTPLDNVSSSGKILVTVINKAPIPQDVYCEGIFIFNINPGETKTFRFQKGNWRIDLCYPGSFPCNNYSYVDMTYDKLTYTIRN